MVWLFFPSFPCIGWKNSLAFAARVRERAVSDGNLKGEGCLPSSVVMGWRNGKMLNKKGEWLWLGEKRQE